MDESKLVELLRLGSLEIPGGTHFCPDDKRIVEYFEGTLQERDLNALRRHLVECRHCQARIGNLERLSDGNEPRRLEGEVLAQAKRLDGPIPGRLFHHPPAWAAAAVVLAVLTTVLVTRLPGESANAPTNTEPPSLQDRRQVRNVEPRAIKPGILAPTDGSRVASDGLTIRWTAVGGSLHYNVRVVDTEGFIIHHGRVQDATEWTPPISHLLEPGNSYFVRVDAYLAEADTVSSDHVLFIVEDVRP